MVHQFQVQLSKFSSVSLLCYAAALLMSLIVFVLTVLYSWSGASKTSSVKVLWSIWMSMRRAMLILLCTRATSPSESLRQWTVGMCAATYIIIYMYMYFHYLCSSLLCVFLAWCCGIEIDMFHDIFLGHFFAEYNFLYCFSCALL